MCIIAVLKAGVDLPGDDVLNRCWSSNPDGGGLMYEKDGAIEIRKSLDRTSFITLLKEHRKAHMDKDFVFHMRWATHGNVDIPNTHPFVVHNDLAFMHNGTIHNCAPKSWTSTVSDTYNFNVDVMKELKNKIYSTPFDALISDYIGLSKLVFLHPEHGIKIINESFGEWTKDGIWYSSDYWKAPRKTTYGSTNYNRTKPKPFCRNCGIESRYDKLSTLYLTYGAEWDVAKAEVCWSCLYQFKNDHDIDNITPADNRYSSCYTCTDPADDVYMINLDHKESTRVCTDCEASLIRSPDCTEKIFNVHSITEGLGKLGKEAWLRG